VIPEGGHTRRLLTTSDVRDLARRHGIRPSKALGQNFVIDPNTIRRIVRLAAVDAEDRVLEVGAGLGTLTLALAAAARQVIAVEFDRALLPALEEVLEGVPNVEIVAADAMAVEYGSLLGGLSHRFISNLPFNLATPLITKLLEEVLQIGDFTVMVQREVGERLVASPGSKVYGSISVLVGYYAEGKVLGRVSPNVFWPPPRVESVLIQLVRRPPPVDVPIEPLMKATRAAFSQRRKTVRNALAAALGRDPDEVEKALNTAEVDPGSRAESLGLEDFARIAKAFET
jgi:16S rRNA (adenine1518-N6/adenine1519-N6)-dimethyltransferase